MAKSPIDAQNNNTPLFTQIQTLIANARSRVATVVNQELVTLYWAIGQHIRQDILNANRAEYGKQIIVTLSAQLTLEYGKGWSEKQLRHCMRLSEAFPDQKILSAVQRELSWTHIKMIMPIDDELKRSFATVYPYGGAGGEAPEKNIFSRLRREKKRISKGFALWIPLGLDSYK